MKIKRKKIWVGALSALALASLSVATVGIAGVKAKAATVDFAKDANKWQTLTNVSVNANKGLVPAANGADIKWTATTVNVGGNSSAEITTSFAEGGGIWGVMTYFMKWNEGTDAVNWAYDSNAALPFDGNSGSGMNVASASGDWVALVVNTVTMPAVYECSNGVVSYKGNLAKNGIKNIKV